LCYVDWAIAEWSLWVRTSSPGTRIHSVRTMSRTQDGE
jgi:hypothetical protein